MLFRPVSYGKIVWHPHSVGKIAGSIDVVRKKFCPNKVMNGFLVQESEQLSIVFRDPSSADVINGSQDPGKFIHSNVRQSKWIIFKESVDHEEEDFHVIVKNSSSVAVINKSPSTGSISNLVIHPVHDVNQVFLGDVIIVR